MLIKDSISGYKHLDVGNIKIAFTMVCKDDWFKNIYLNSNSIYIVKSGKAILKSRTNSLELNKGEVALIKQHSILDIRKFKDENGSDFQSFIFQLFPDFVSECIEKNEISEDKIQSDLIKIDFVQDFWNFSENLKNYFKTNKNNQTKLIKEKTFEAVQILAKQNQNFLSFLQQHNKSVKIDLYEFMIHNVLSNNSIKEYAQLTGRSLSAFKRDFKAIFKTTPHQWILSKKMDLAEELLTKQNMKSTDFYQFLGFNELSHFSMTYKKLKGISPTQV